MNLQFHNIDQSYLQHRHRQVLRCVLDTGPLQAQAQAQNPVGYLDRGHAPRDQDGSLRSCALNQQNPRLSQDMGAESHPQRTPCDLVSGIERSTLPNLQDPVLRKFKGSRSDHYVRVRPSKLHRVAESVQAQYYAPARSDTQVYVHRGGQRVNGGGASMERMFAGQRDQRHILLTGLH